MTVQIRASVTTPTIADIYKRMTSGELDLVPDFQRNFVWTQDHQEEFIETILKGFPFPEIYVCRGETDTKTMSTSHKVIDGQQRLTTIRNYFENNFSKPLRKVPLFTSLDDEQTEAFISYEVVFRDIGKVDDTLVREIFRRINLTKFNLQSIEIRNAIYDGKYLQTAKELADELALNQFGVFYESEFTRMVDINFFLQVMTTLENGGYYNREVELENYIAEFNEEYPNSSNIKKTISKAFLTIEKLQLDADSIWFRKSNFFTLFVEVCTATSIPSDLRSRLVAFEKSIVDNRTDKSNEFGLYYGYMYAGTNNRKARITRSDLFKKYVL